MQQKLQKASMRMSRIKKYILENKKDNYDPRDYEAALRQTDLGDKDTPSYIQAAQALALASKGLELTDEQQKALAPYVSLFSQLLVNPRYRSRLHSMIRLINKPK
jgi:hypothetical protein